MLRRAPSPAPPSSPPPTSTSFQSPSRPSPSFLTSLATPRTLLLTATAVCGMGLWFYLSRRSHTHSIMARREIHALSRVVAKEMKTWDAKVVQCLDMTYADGARADLDRPGFVRSASSLRLLSPPVPTLTPHQYQLHMSVIQDDVNLVAHAHLMITTFPKPQIKIERIASVPLSRGPKGLRQYDESRGNKKFKLDLESSVFIPKEMSPTGSAFYLGFGSGSVASRARDVIVYIPTSMWESSVEIVDEDIITVPRVWNEVYEKQEEKKDQPPPISTSTTAVSPPRDHIMMFHVPQLFDIFRANKDFSGSELNIEGWEWFGSSPSTLTFRVFQRGNGASDPAHGLQPVNATADIHGKELFTYIDQLLIASERPPLFYQSLTQSPVTPPTIHNIIQYDLGSLGGVQLGFTDAARIENTKFMYIGGAEASPDVTRDGEVVGATVGIVTDDDARYTKIKNPDNTSFMGKAEGLLLVPHSHVTPHHNEHHVLLSLDPDSTTTPSQLCYMILTTPKEEA